VKNVISFLISMRFIRVINILIAQLISIKSSCSRNYYGIGIWICIVRGACVQIPAGGGPHQGGSSTEEPAASWSFSDCQTHPRARRRNFWHRRATNRHSWWQRWFTEWLFACSIVTVIDLLLQVGWLVLTLISGWVDNLQRKFLLIIACVVDYRFLQTTIFDVCVYTA